jgi:hypothetical protein
LNRDNKVETTRISSFYRFASNNNETIQSWYNLTADQVWKLPELDTKWDIYADLQFDWSEENSWQQRIAAHFGGQYPLLTIRKSEENPIWFDSLVLNGRVGVGPRKEFSGLNTDVVAEGDFGGNLTWHIADGHSVTANGSYMPDLEDFNQYRIDATLNWKIALKSFEGLSLEVGVKYQFQSEVQSDDKNYDLLATVGLTYDF